jgi:DNA-binding transcriptional regulator YiaG
MIAEDPDLAPQTEALRALPTVRAVRRKLGLGHEKFARQLSLPVAVVRRSERGQAETDPAVQALLRIVGRTPGPTKKKAGLKRKSRLTEAINRAEATALLIRCGSRVYRPEADVEGEDLVLRTPAPQQKFIVVQLKARPDVNNASYGGRDIWMLFPSEAVTPRTWYLIPHDTLFAWFKERHGHTEKWTEQWRTVMNRELREFLSIYEIKLPPGIDEALIEN